VGLSTAFVGRCHVLGETLLIKGKTQHHGALLDKHQEEKSMAEEKSKGKNFCGEPHAFQIYRGDQKVSSTKRSATNCVR
jgi:hypothetical protein